MANTEIKYASLENFVSYDKLIKEHISSEIDTAVSTKASSNHTHSIADVNELQVTLDSVNESIEQKSQVQIITSGNSESLQTLKIHKLTQEQYNEALSNGTLEDNALYLTPDEEIDLSQYATTEQLNTKANSSHAHEINDVNNLQITLDELLNESKKYTDNTLSNKANSSHTHDDIYYTESEIDEKLLNKADALHSHDEYATKSHNHDDDYYTEIEIDTMLSNKSDVMHNHDDNYDAKGSAEAALNSAKSYADSAASTAANTVKNDLLNGAGGAYDTLKELGDLINENVDAIEAIEIVANGKADASHSHNDIYYTETEVDEKISTINNSISASLSASKSYSDANLAVSKTYTDNEIAQKTQVQIITWGADD